MSGFTERLKHIAWSIPAPNKFTPLLMELAVVADMRDAHMEMLIAALRNLIAAEDDYGDGTNVAVNQALDTARNALRRVRP